MRAHEIDFEIFGDDMQFVEVELDPGETAIAEAGAMMYMDQGIRMATIFGDGSAQSDSVMGKIFGAGKRVLTGESLFITAFTNVGSGKQRVAFSAPYPGKIVPLDLAALGGKSSARRMPFCVPPRGSRSGSHSRSGSASDSSAGRVSSSSACRETAWLSPMPEEPSLRGTWCPERP